MKNYQLNVKHERGSIQQILLLFVVALILVAMVMAVFGYKIGHKQGSSKAGTVVVQSEEQSNTQELDKLKKQLETVTQERDIGLSNIENLETQNEVLTTQNLQITQFNALLLDSVAKAGGVPLRVLASEIASLPDRTFEYRFDVAMVDRSGKAVMMTPKLTLLNATNMVEIPLKPATYEINGIARIRGRFVMPDEFEPKQMKISMQAGNQNTEELYNWQVGKVIGMTEGEPLGGLDERPVGSETQKP
ncbi:hypothetical protein [Moraxella sp. VT-16-12]|uniref:hypothetical protein n=1 Tax=Moraxella sp. VT-16-12 TaxID=2014877 RepID=UPI000B7EE5FF|nr:hypothetical protein [Moraxella sp. VT-16-12]TWV83555.1 hypothetical protein CEW93_004010 [Moraxella sp. VT-16-12]